MNKKEFLELLNNAKVDENGNLYYLEKICETDDDELAHKVYFSTIRTICADLVDNYCWKDKEEGYELYDRHFIDDDTLEAQIVKEE